MYRLGLVLIVLCSAGGLVRAEPSTDIKTAAHRGLTRVIQAARTGNITKLAFLATTKHFPCLRLSKWHEPGVSIDQPWLKSQADSTHAEFQKRIHAMNRGEHVPGGAATVGFALWALALDRRVPDETTTAMAEYLLQIQGVVRLTSFKTENEATTNPVKENDGHWQASCRRAPMQASLVGDTVLAMMGLERYATEAQRPRWEKARAAGMQWLAKAPLRDQQDRLWMLWGLHQLGDDVALKQNVFDAILSAQREDGGWAESQDRESDSYSTGQTLFMLLKVGVALDHSSIVRARDYLLKTQYEDGSWLAKSHVKFKAQSYFETVIHTANTSSFQQLPRLGPPLDWLSYSRQSLRRDNLKT